MKRLSSLWVLKENGPTFLVVLAFLLLFGQAVRKGFQPGMPAYGDAFSFPLTVASALSTFRAAYDVRNPGIDLPVASVLSFLTIAEAAAGVIAGGNMVIPARLFYFYLPLPLMFLSMYWFLGKLSLSRPAKLIAAFIYAVNFFTIGEVLGGFPGTNYVQVLFPVILFSLYRSKFLLFSVIFALAYILSDHVIIFIIPFFLLFLFLGFRRGGTRGFIHNLVFIISSAVLVVLLTLPYTYFYLKIAFPFLGGQPLREDILSFLIRNVHDSYRYYTLGDALRLGGSSFINLYGLDLSTVKAGFLIPLLAFSWFIFPANRNGSRFKSGLFFSLMAVLALAFIYDAHRSEAIALFRRFPFFFRFRNPVRPTLFLAFAYAPLIALTLDGFYNSLSSYLKRKKAVILLLAVTGLIFAGLSYYLKPFYSGDYTFSKNRGMTYTIGERYYALKNWLEEKRAGGGEFRTLWLPYNHEEVEIKVRYIDPWAYAVPINYGSYADNNYLKWMTRGYLKLSLGDYSSLSDLATAGVRYLILNEASQETGPVRYEYDYLTPWLPGSPDNWRVILQSLPGLSLKEKIAGFAVYENSHYRAEGVDAFLAGYPPEDILQRQRTKDILVIISGVTWLAILAFLGWQRVFRRPGR